MKQLSVKDLYVSMGIQKILKGVSVEVNDGEIVAVLGGNGVGKTTLMRALSGIYKVASGTITLDGQDITNMPSHKVVDNGILQAPEGRQIFASMTIRENLVLGGGPLGTEQLDQVLSLFPVLESRLNQAAGSLSGGEQQMLCIGRALMRNPKILLLDEPSLGLAPKMVKAIIDLVARIRDDGVSVLIVEQNAMATLQVADRAIILDDGEVKIRGDAKDLLTDPRVMETYLGMSAE